ncbi:hypothetical protein DDZ14_16950 [Maritimibacter sp. 55A14]|nr:hypothetical protein DDZ14_16950 [Maritimibacter sp. 55A14]
MPRCPVRTSAPPSYPRRPCRRSADRAAAGAGPGVRDPWHATCRIARAGRRGARRARYAISCRGTT